MKKLLFNFIILFISIQTSLFSQNVKILDLTSNTYSSGSSFYVPIGAQMQVTDTWTFEGWVYVDSRGSNDYPNIMDRRTVFSMYLIDGASGGDYCVRFVARNTSDNIIASLRCDGNEGSSAFAMNFGKWYHVAVSRDGTTARMFIDGTEVHSSTDPDFVLSTPSGNAVNYGGRFWGSYERFLDGALDEMRYSDIARYTSNFSISKHSSPHPTSGDGNTILLFNFDNSDLTNSTSANSYSATANGTLTYSDYNALSDDLPLDGTLPLDIQNFNAKASGSEVILTWNYANQINPRVFEIQKSLDNKLWEKIGYVKSEKGKTDYSFVDNNPGETNYYRLKIVDPDGNYQLSKVVSLAYKDYQDINIFPNPVDDVIYISGLKDNTPVEYEIYDIFGKKIEKGLTSGMIRLNNKVPGMYFLQMNRKTQKFIVK